MRAETVPLTLTLSPLRVERELLVRPNPSREPPLPAGEGRGEGRPGRAC